MACVVVGEIFAVVFVVAFVDIVVACVDEAIVVTFVVDVAHVARIVRAADVGNFETSLSFLNYVVCCISLLEVNK